MPKVKTKNLNESVVTLAAVSGDAAKSIAKSLDTKPRYVVHAALAAFSRLSIEDQFAATNDAKLAVLKAEKANPPAEAAAA